jgi:fibronectin-binding autotransporter adhesin
VALLTVAAGPAQAQTFAITSSPPTNIVIEMPPPPTYTRVTVSSSAVSVTGSVINNGIVRANGSAVAVNLNQGTFAGGITNNSTIAAANGSALVVAGPASVIGGISNATAGTISTNVYGIQIGGSPGSVSSFSGGITNNGSIRAGSVGIGVGTSRGLGIVSTFSGGITNTGTVSGVNGAVVVNLASIFSGTVRNTGSFSGNIVNTGTGSLHAFDTAVEVENVASFGGSITNAGTLQSGQEGAGAGISLQSVSLFTGNIANTKTIVASRTGIALGNFSSFAGGITNIGSITAESGIQFKNGSTFSGGVTNAGLISVSNSAIFVGNVLDFSQGITNSAEGKIFGKNGISVGSSDSSVITSFSGGITNAGTISASSRAIQLLNVSNFSSGITNSGRISGGYGISVGSHSGDFTVATFSGGITNSGVISVTKTGIQVNNVASFSGSTANAGGIVNTQTIMAGRLGISVAGTSYTDGGSTFSGGITNTGLISAAATGVQVTSVLGFSGGITNGGTIFGSNGIRLGSGSALSGVSTFSGGITNTGTISASSIGILLQNTPSVTIFDSGTITGASGTAIEFSSGVNTLILGPNFVINGNVEGFRTDVLQLGGSGTGSFNLNNIGTQYTGFTTFSVISATWAVTGTNANNWSIASGATLQLGDGTTSGLITGNFTDNGTLAFDEPTTTTIASTITGAGSVAQTGPGTVVLSGTNGYTGGTTISAGTLQVTNDFSIGTGSVTLSGGTFQVGATGLVFDNAFVLDSGSDTIDTQANTLALSGLISGAGSLVKIGSGSLTLTGTSNYTGATTVSAGTLEAGAANVFAPLSAFTVASGATVVLGGFNQTIGSLAGSGNVSLATAVLTTGNDNTSTIYAGTISGAGGSLVKIGAGTLTLSGTNNNTGFTSVNAGTLQAGAANAFAGSSAFTVAAGAILDLNGFNQTIGSLAGSGNVTLGTATLTTGNDNTSTTYAGTMSGTGSLVKIGSGTLTLSGTSSYTGATSVNAGTLQAGAANVFAGSSAFTLAAGAILDLNNFNQTIGSLAGSGSVTLGTATLTTGSDNTSTTYAGTVSGSGALVKIGTGTLTLSGTSNYTGATDVNAGTLQAGAVNAFAPSSAFTVASGATLDLNSFNQTIGSLAGSGGVTLGTATLTTGNDDTSTTYAGTIGGMGSLVKIGSGTLTLSGTSSYTGATDVNAGTLQAGAANAFAGSSAFTVVSGAVLDLNSFNQVIGSLSGAGDVALGTATLTTGNDNTSTLYSGTIFGSGGLVKTGSGTLTLTGTSSYTGATTVAAGTLQAGAVDTFAGASAFTIASGAVLDLNNGDQIIGSLAGSGNVTLGTATLTTGNDDTSTSYSGAISGTGSLVKIGSGTLTLSGTSSYTGGTMIDAGTLAVGNSSALGMGGVTLADGTVLQAAANGLSLANALTLNGAATFDSQSNTLSLSGTIAGNGSLAKIGAGTLTLTGANTYSGGTSLNAGTLAIGNSSALGTGGVTLAGGTVLQAATSGLSLANALTLNGGATFDSQSNTLSLSGTIAGSGSLAKIGAGTLTLTGANTYSGGTSLNAGTLAIGNNAALGTGGVTLADGTTLQAATNGLSLANALTLNGAAAFDSQSNTLRLNGTIGGSGSLTKIGAGTLTLTAANTYSGGTSLNAGTLAIGNNAALGTGGVTLAGGTVLQAATSGLSLANALTLNGATTLDSQSNVASLNGAISGSGSLTKIGNGFVTLNGTNSYTGGTAVLGGTLIGTTASLQGNILDNAALVFDQATAGTYAGSLSGDGTLTVHGAAVTLTGDDSGFTGETRLAQGALAVGTLAAPDAVLGGTVDVFSGGLLSGHGTVGTVNNVAGTVMPGGSIGVLTVNGSYTQSSTGTLLIQVTPTAASQLRVTGPAVLGGTLELVYQPGTYTPRTYTFLTSPSISGAFNSVDSVDPPPLSQGLSINPATGQLVLGGGAVSVAPIDVTIFPEMTTVLVQNAQQANSIVLDRLSDRLAGNGMAAGGIAAAPGMQLAQLGNTNLGNTEALATVLPQALVDRGAWFRGLGSFGSVNGNSIAPGFDTASGGFLAGFDQPVAPGVIAGLAAGYTRSNVNEHSTSSGDVNTARVMAYGGGPLGTGLWSATVGYAHDSISTQRGLPGIGNEQASYDGNELTLGAQWSQPLHFGDTTIVPQAGARFLRLFEGGFAETGTSGFDLIGESNSATSLQPFVGATASRTIVTDNGTQITPMLALGYAREVANDNRSIEVNATDGTTFLVNGIRPSRDILTAGGGLTVKARDNLYVYADYDASLPVGNTVNQTFSLGVRIPFPPYAASTSEPEMPAIPALDGTAGADQPELQAKQQELFNKMFSAPADLDATLGYAAVSARLGDNEGAAEALERLLLFNPNLATAQLELGVLYYRMGSFAAAQAYLDKARSLNPSPEVLAQIDEYTAKVAAAQQTNALSGTFSFGTQYQTDANVAPGSPLIRSPIGDILLSNQFVKHDDTSFFGSGSLLYSYGLNTQDGDAIEVTGTGFGNHYLEFNHLDLDFGEATVGPRLRYPDLGWGPVQMATVKPYAILNEVGLGERQYFWTYGAGFETTAVLWDDLSARTVYEFRQKDFTNAPDRPLSNGLSGNDNLFRLMLSKPVTLNSQILGEFDYLDQSTRFAYYANNTYSASLGYHITYEDPMRLLNLPWETVVYGSRTWSIYEAPDPCCNTSGSSTMFSTSARDDRHWRFGITQSFQLTANTALVTQLQRDIVSSNLPLYGYSSDSLLVDLKVSF